MVITLTGKAVNSKKEQKDIIFVSDVYDLVVDALATQFPNSQWRGENLSGLKWRQPTKIIVPRITARENDALWGRFASEYSKCFAG